MFDYNLYLSIFIKLKGGRNMEFETKCLHAGYQPENGGPRVLPIVQC